ERERRDLKGSLFVFSYRTDWLGLKILATRLPYSSGGIELLSRRQPPFQMFLSLPIKTLRDDAGHAFRIDPRHLPFPSNAHPHRQLKAEAYCHRMPERFHGVYRHSPLTKVRHARTLFEFSFFQHHREIHGMSKVPPP